MARTNKSAKSAGARFERAIADYLRDNLSEFIDRKVRTGALDTGDLANVRTSYNQRVTCELKDYGGRLLPAQWLAEVEAERVNDDGHVGVVIAKRKGVADPGNQYVILTVDTLIKLLKGE